MFEKSLTDLIRGIRANKKNEAAYIGACIEEIRKELKQNDPDIKTQAVSKLTYLQTMGYEMGWASFHVVEVMSSPNFANKRIGYLAAVQSFRQHTDVLMLTTNLLRKDLASSNYLEVALAVTGLADIMTADLGRDLSQELVGLLHHSRPYVRKRAVLTLYKASLKHPDVLLTAWPKLKELLDDPDPAVVSTTINVICELACHNPANYLGLAPHMFALLTSSSNNWMLIKIIKLFRALTPFEPRLARKLLPPITNIIKTTPAMSLLYECVLTVISTGMLNVSGAGGDLARICVDKLRRFLEDADQNLKYIGLLALGKILDVHPDLVADHRDIVLRCIDDPDYSIRARALDLVSGMVTRRNLPEIVLRLTTHLRSMSAERAPTALESLRVITGSVIPAQSRKCHHEFPSSCFLDATFRADIIRCVIGACSADKYTFVPSFDWYLTVLVELAYAASQNPSRDLGPMISGQLMDVAVRVKSARNTAVKLMTQILADVSLLETAVNSAPIAPILEAAAWICGEYCGFLSDPSEVLSYLMKPDVVHLPGFVQQVFIHNALKIFIHWLGTLGYTDDDVVRDISLVGNSLLRGLELFTVDEHIETQERACSAAVVVRLIVASFPSSSEADPSSSPLPSAAKLSARFASFRPLFFSAELNPVAPQAQCKVPVPEGLDLSAWIHAEAADEGQPPPAYRPEALGLCSSNGAWGDVMFEAGGIAVGRGGQRGENDQEHNARVKVDPFYLLSGTRGHDPGDRQGYDPVDDIPIVQLALDNAQNGWDPIKHVKSLPHSPPPVEIDHRDEMPEGTVLSNEELRDMEPTVSTSNERKGKDDASRKKEKKKRRDVLDVDHAALKNVDFQKLPVSAPGLKPSLAPYPTFEFAQPDQTLQLQAVTPEAREGRRWPENLVQRQDEPIVHAAVKTKKKKQKSKITGETDERKGKKTRKKKEKKDAGLKDVSADSHAGP